ncbi:MAG: SPOR domain-containing protein, partial [Bacteroidetes bacterium]|nr:SPOR domain-containing protein [Bacteroidota bacterium]
MLGFAAGVMIAASIWSLLVPAISLAEEMNLFPLVPATTGFLAGAFFIWGINKVLPHMHSGLREEKPEVVEPAPVEESWRPAPPKEGSVTAITARTGRYYVVVGSFIDGDMAGDYAKKLAAAGRQVTLIEPSGNRKFYRLGIMDAGSFGEASAQLDDLKSTFGQEIWVYKY